MSFDPASLGFDSIRALHFLRPQWLWLLLALPLMAWLWRRRRARQSVWRSVVDPHLLPHLLQARQGVRGISGLWLGLIATALAVCALAGPSWNRVEQPLWQSRAPLVVALDLSRATAASDLPPSRLLQARGKIASLLRQRAGGQVGLVVFADDAYTVAPLTDDAGNIALFLDALSPDIMPGADAPGQDNRADRAINWSADLLRQAGFDRGDILLLSDHADSAASTAAATAAANGYRVSVLGLGTAKGAAYRDSVGRIAHARLDEGSLRALANAGGGGYVAMTADDQDLTALGVLDPQQAGTMAAHGEKTQVWQDQGYWLLLPVLLLAAFAFRRGGALAALLLCVWLPMAPAHAADGDWWRRPDQQQHRQLEQGAEAYRKQDYAAAEKDWQGLPGADAAYNRGNALAKIGDYDAAIAQYDEALRLQPGMEDAIANKAAVEAAKKRQPPSGKQQGQNDKQDQDKNGQKQDQSGQPDDKGDQSQSSKDQSSSGQKSDEQKQGEQQDKQPSSSKPGEVDKSQPDQASDPESQRQADTAQRERMQQALKDADKGKPGQQQQARAAKPDETPAERERRIANEAALRRVPDDPGGLLRARFQLEYQRRQQEGR